MFQGKRLILSENTLHRHKIVGEFVEGKLTRKEVALALSLSERQISRLVDRWVKGGPTALEHGLRGRSSGRKTPEALRGRVIELAKEKYVNFNFKHLSEVLWEWEGIKLSYSSIKRWLSPLKLVKKARRRRIPRHRRERYSSPGLMVQMDGSEHRWVNGKVWVLIAGIDDATSDVPYGEFFETEGLYGYLQVVRKILELRGIPRILYVDHAAWLSGTSKNDETGQFKRLCDELGITLIFANSPQAKGRVERLWGTLQDRLVAELRFHKITDKLEATRYFNEVFLPKTWRKRFTVPPKSKKTLYRTAPGPKGLDEIFCHKYVRKVRNDHTVLWQNQLYSIKADLGYSIAKSAVEIRVYSDGTARGFYAGRDLEFKRVMRPMEPTQNRPQKPPLCGLNPGLLVQNNPRKGVQTA